VITSSLAASALGALSRVSQQPLFHQFLARPWNPTSFQWDDWSEWDDWSGWVIEIWSHLIAANAKSTQDMPTEGFTTMHSETPVSQGEFGRCSGFLPFGVDSIQAKKADATARSRVFQPRADLVVFTALGLITSRESVSSSCVS
jgi:hypothetical protein